MALRPSNVDSAHESLASKNTKNPPEIIRSEADNSSEAHAAFDVQTFQNFIKTTGGDTTPQSPIGSDLFTPTAAQARIRKSTVGSRKLVVPELDLIHEKASNELSKASPHSTAVFHQFL